MLPLLMLLMLIGWCWKKGVHTTEFYGDYELFDKNTLGASFRCPDIHGQAGFGTSQALKTDLVETMTLKSTIVAPKKNAENQKVVHHYFRDGFCFSGLSENGAYPQCLTIFTGKKNDKPSILTYPIFQRNQQIMSKVSVISHNIPMI